MPIAAAVLLVGAVAASAPSKIDHVCAKDEGTETCPSGRVRMCAKDGSLAACTCPPGAVEKNKSCVADASPVNVACVVPDATIAKSMAPFLEFGALEMPSLPTSEPPGTRDLAAAVAGKGETATDAQLVAAAKAWDTIEGAAAYDALSKWKPNKAKLATRDQANGEGISVRRAFLARFGSSAHADEQRVAQARGLLRRAAYTGVGTSVDADRKAAHQLLDAVVASGVDVRASRDAAFMLAEQAVRDKDWGTVLGAQSRVLKWAGQKSQADDHAFLAAASVRIAQARMETGDVPHARPALEDAIAIGMSCAPRAECVVAAGGARRALAATWAATSAPARSMVPLLQKGVLPRLDRVRPLLQLADVYAKGSGAGCAAAAEEARAWEQAL